MGADIQELHENAELAAASESLTKVSITMSVLAVIGAIVSMMGSRVHADMMLNETMAADQWNEYQAQKIRQRNDSVVLDELSVFALQNPASVTALKTKYQSEVDRYTKQTNDLQNQANATQAAVATLERRSNYLDYSEALLETSLVICSITLLTKKEHYWYAGVLIGGTGTALAVIGLLIH